jgi:hypothetical protein
MGTAGTMMIHPWGAILIGMCAGSVSTLGYIYLTPWLEKKITLHDTAGNNFDSEIFFQAFAQIKIFIFLVFLPES